ICSWEFVVQMVYPEFAIPNLQSRDGGSQGERMKRAAIVIAMLGITAWGFGQSTDKPATQNAQAGQQPGQATAPQGKRPPQAQTHPEFDAYKVAAALTDPVAQEKAADDLAAQFPDSELRSVLYKSATHG